MGAQTGFESGGDSPHPSRVRGLLLVRDALVRTRTRYLSLIRALLRQQGYRVPSGSAEAFVPRVRAWPCRARCSR
jgi:hypothetical protein